MMSDHSGMENPVIAQLKFRWFRLVHFIQFLLSMWALDRAHKRKANKADKERLEAEYLKYIGQEKSSFVGGAEQALRTILAYKYWEDGAEWYFVEEVWHSDPYWTAAECLETLKMVFNYEVE